MIRSAQPATLIVCRVKLSFEFTIKCTLYNIGSSTVYTVQCSVQYSVEYILKKKIDFIVRYNIPFQCNGNKSSQLGTWTSGYILVYITVYSTVHCTVQ